MDALFRGLSLFILGAALTWLLSMGLGRLATRKGAARWVWNQGNTIGFTLLAAGLALAGWGLSLGAGASGSSLILLGSLLGMGGMWLIGPAPKA